ncbi:MAG: hypothetical protein ABI616_00210 [Pseudomonadota bacterium]
MSKVAGPAALAMFLALAALPVRALDSLHLQAASVAIAGTTIRDASATLSIHSATSSTLSMRAAGVAVPAALAAQTGPQVAVRVACENPVIREPVFACPALTLEVVTQRWPSIILHGGVTWHSDSGALTANGTGPDLAGSPVKFASSINGAVVRAQLDMPGVSLAQVASLLKPWITLPDDLQVSGTGTLSATLQRNPTADTATIGLRVHDGGMQNAASTVIGEKIEASVSVVLTLPRDPHAQQGVGFEVAANGTHGQLLGGPVLLDLDRNPLQLRGGGTWSDNALHVAHLESTQRDLLSATGTADITIAPLHVRNAEITASEITFPAAYTSYMQLLLNATPFNQLVSKGKAHALVRLENDLPVQLTLVVDDLSFDDGAREIHVTGVRSELFWSAGETGPPRPSFVTWKSARGWGIEGAESRVDFATHDRDFSLLKPARLPLFDGALLVNTLAVEHLGQPDMSGKFDAVVEPISVAPIAKAMQWPEFSGRLSGRIPGLTYKGGVLTLEGNLEASVFDGEILASNLRVRDPLGKWPRLYADVTARNLDLELVTNTFEFGSITGRLDVDLKGLETFGWSPVAFDLKMATPPGDKSRHRISQRAVANLSNIGGGGGGVATALQSGALKFFDTFHYDQIGISCRLRNDVCQMSGVGPVGNGYYILRGAGIPRLDIIGKSSRVDWPRFVSQVTSAINNSDSIVVN